jgi:hypothetical protein
MFRCLSVVYDEGLRSYKAIAFIRSNPKSLSTKPFSYLELGATLASTVLTNKKPFRGFSKKLGEEKLWKN